MQLPFVLQSAETMKTAVAYLEPHMEKVGGSSAKGKLVLATVKGDVHDIGKNLVDIICTNNGYEVHNLGIKVPISEMVAKVKEVDADALGMSGLLVKSTLIMRDNLEELNSLGLTDDAGAARRRRADPALRRARPARDLRGPAVLRQGRLRGPEHARPADGHEAQRRRGTRLRDRAHRAGAARALGRGPTPRRRRCPAARPTSPPTTPCSRRRSSVRASSRASASTRSPSTSTRPRCTATSGSSGPEKDADGRPESDDEFKDRIRAVFREQLAAAKASGVLVPQVVYGYFPANGDGDDLVVWTDESRTTEAARFHYPRQQAAPFLCIADFFRPDRVRRDRTTPPSTSSRWAPRSARRRPQLFAAERVPAVPPAARPRGRDGRGAGRVLAPPDP